MIYFGYPLDIHGWKPKPETEPETKPKPEPENHGQKTNTKPETRKTETRGYPHRTRFAAISRPTAHHLGVGIRFFGSVCFGSSVFEEIRFQEISGTEYFGSRLFRFGFGSNQIFFIES